MKRILIVALLLLSCHIPLHSQVVATVTDQIVSAQEWFAVIGERNKYNLEMRYIDSLPYYIQRCIVRDSIIKSLDRDNVGYDIMFCEYPGTYLYNALLALENTHYCYSYWFMGYVSTPPDREGCCSAVSKDYMIANAFQYGENDTFFINFYRMDNGVIKPMYSYATNWAFGYCDSMFWHDNNTLYIPEWVSGSEPLRYHKIHVDYNAERLCIDTVTIEIVVDGIGMYAPRGEASKPPYPYPSTAIAFHYKDGFYYIPVEDSCSLRNMNIALRDTARLTIVSHPGRIGHAYENPMMSIIHVERVKSDAVHDTLCRLILAFDTLYVTDADAHWHVVSELNGCFGWPATKIHEPVWTLQMNDEFCHRIGNIFPLAAEYYQRSNRMWIKMSLHESYYSVNGIGIPDCELLFVFNRDRGFKLDLR